MVALRRLAIFSSALTLAPGRWYRFRRALLSDSYLRRSGLSLPRTRSTLSHIASRMYFAES